MSFANAQYHCQKKEVILKTQYPIIKVLIKKVQGKRRLYLMGPPPFLQPWRCHPCKIHHYQRFCLSCDPFTDSKLFLRLPLQTCFSCHTIKPKAWQIARHWGCTDPPALAAPIHPWVASWKNCKSSDVMIPIVFSMTLGQEEEGRSPLIILSTKVTMWPTFENPIPAPFSEEMKEVCSHLPHIKL